MTIIDHRAAVERPATFTGTWLDQAACHDLDPEDFFPPPTAIVQIMDAKAVCGGCPVRAACLQQAFDLGAQDGVWGGASEVERARARRRVLRGELPTTTANLVAATERILAEQQVAL